MVQILKTDFMKELQISKLRKKNRHLSIRVSKEEREALERFCLKEQISFADFFRVAIRKMVNAKKVK